MTARIATICGKPAYHRFAGRVTAAMIREHGSYDAARRTLSAQLSLAFDGRQGGVGHG